MMVPYYKYIYYLDSLNHYYNILINNDLGIVDGGSNMSIHDKLNSIMDRLGGTIKEETILGDLEYTQYKNASEITEIQTIDIKDIIPNYYYLSKDHFRYEIVTITPTNQSSIGTLNIDGTTYVKTKMPELSYDNSTGIISVKAGYLQVQGTVGYTRYVGFKTIRVIYRGLDS